MRSFLRWPFAIPLLVVVLLAGALGFLLTRHLVPVADPSTVRLSAIALPATPTPTPEPTPEATPEPPPAAEPRPRAPRTPRGTRTPAIDCPAGCRCESRPPGGIVIVCPG